MEEQELVPVPVPDKSLQTEVIPQARRVALPTSDIWMEGSVVDSGEVSLRQIGKESSFKFDIGPYGVSADAFVVMIAPAGEIMNHVLNDPDQFPQGLKGLDSTYPGIRGLSPEEEVEIIIPLSHQPDGSWEISPVHTSTNDRKKVPPSPNTFLFHPRVLRWGLNGKDVGYVESNHGFRLPPDATIAIDGGLQLEQITSHPFQQPTVEGTVPVLGKVKKVICNMQSLGPWESPLTKPFRNPDKLDTTLLDLTYTKTPDIVKKMLSGEYAGIKTSTQPENLEDLFGTQLFEPEKWKFLNNEHEIQVMKFGLTLTRFFLQHEAGLSFADAQGYLQLFKNWAEAIMDGRRTAHDMGSFLQPYSQDSGYVHRLLGLFEHHKGIKFQEVADIVLAYLNNPFLQVPTGEITVQRGRKISVAEGNFSILHPGWSRHMSVTGKSTEATPHGINIPHTGVLLPKPAKTGESPLFVSAHKVTACFMPGGFTCDGSVIEADAVIALGKVGLKNTTITATTIDLSLATVLDESVIFQAEGPKRTLRITGENSNHDMQAQIHDFVDCYFEDVAIVSSFHCETLHLGGDAVVRKGATVECDTLVIDPKFLKHRVSKTGGYINCRKVIFENEDGEQISEEKKKEIQDLLGVTVRKD